MNEKREKHIALVANGYCEDLTWLKNELLVYEEIIAVDGGMKYLSHLEMEPSLHIGDFDSSTPENTPVSRYPKEKDQSDLAIAVLEAEKLGASQVTLYCSLGLRVDHLLANLFLSASIERPNVLIKDSLQSLFCITSSCKLHVEKGTTISFMPIDGAIKNVKTKGLKWNLQDQELSIKQYSLSNIAMNEEVEIHFLKGVILVTLQRNISSLNKILF